MATERKNFDWIDSIRVLSTLVIIIFHYAVLLMDNPTFHGTIYKYFDGFGHFGIAAFFGISGYLVVNSLERTPSILEFYRRKFIRVVVPFIVTYILAFGMLLFIKLSSVIFNTPNFFKNYAPLDVVFGMLPIDLNLLKFFDIDYLFLVGEWFVGTIIWLYLLAPLIYKFLLKNIPATMTAAVIVAGIVASFLLEFETQGKIFAVQTIFLVRLPEFATGMALFMYRDKIFQTPPRIFAIFLAVAMTIFTTLQNIDFPSVWIKYYFGDVINFHFVLSASLSVYVSFIAAEFLNRNLKVVMLPINKFKDISYMAVLIQHLVIRLFDKVFDFKTIGGLGAISVFFLILFVIIILSEIIKKYYTPFEKKLLG